MWNIETCIYIYISLLLAGVRLGLSCVEWRALVQAVSGCPTSCCWFAVSRLRLADIGI